MPYTYQWRRNGANIAGATSSNYTLVAADVGTNIDAAVTATNSAGLSSTVNAAAVGPVAAATVAPPVNSAAPSVTGTTTVGQTLTTSNGIWTNSPTSFAYQWLRGGVAIAGATAATYLLVSADQGANISARVTATNAGGSAAATSAATAAIAAAPAGGFDPLSVNPLIWIDLSDLTSLSQLSDGTGAVAATGDPVGRLGDKSGGARHFLQATAAARGIWRTGNYIETDGVDDGYNAAALTGFPATVEIYFAIRNVVDDQFLLASLNSQAGLIGIANPDDQLPPHGGAGAVTVLVNGAAVTPNHRLALRTAIGTTEGKVVEFQNVTTAALITQISLFNFGGLQYQGRLHGMLITPVLTATQRANVRTYLGGKMGVTL